MAFVDILLYIWELFRVWIDTLFVLPVKNTDMLWILVPLWLSWFFGEFFQEKVGTSFGNAISNAVVVLWAGIDCIRQTLGFIHDGVLSITGDIVTRFVLCGVLIGYGIIIIIFGTEVKEKVKIFGRIRDVTYAFAILVPVLYNVAPFNKELIISAIIFFPLFYYIIEFIDVKTPTPKAMKADVEEGEQAKIIDGKIISSGTPNMSNNNMVKPITIPKTVTPQQNNAKPFDKNKPPGSGAVTSYWSMEED